MSYPLDNIIDIREANRAEAIKRLMCRIAGKREKSCVEAVPFFCRNGNSSVRMPEMTRNAVININAITAVIFAACIMIPALLSG